MKVSFGDHDFLLHPSGYLFWKQRSLLIISDLHLEKGSHFARKGFFLPPYDSLETLQRLHHVISELSVQNILILGDCFHDPQGYARLAEQERILFDHLLSYNPIWISGNHDGDFVPQGITPYDQYLLDGITFRHQAEKDTGFEISGHFHPKIDIVHKSQRITRPCFIEDGRKMILPSFGAYTGGLDIKDPSIATLFSPQVRAYPLGKDRVFSSFL